jgi:hypothetical protein
MYDHRKYHGLGLNPWLTYMVSIMQVTMEKVVRATDCFYFKHESASQQQVHSS